MAQCIAPFAKHDKITGELMHFPCGKCIYCLRRRASGWSFRLMQEYNRSYNGYFITFTYDTDRVPITDKGYMSLRKRDWQLFVKKLRKVNPVKLRYFAVGEYGKKGMRPHYHAIMFNVDLTKLLSEKDARMITQMPGLLDGKTQFLSPVWANGYITIGMVSEASCGYVSKYMMKKGMIPQHKNDDRIPEFQLMSKGLGENYLTPAIRNWHHADLLNRFYTPLKDGKKIALPRYYKQKLYTDFERQKIGNHIAQTVEKPDLTGDQEILVWTYSTQQKKVARVQETF